jgi:hypothetical protein
MAFSPIMEKFEIFSYFVIQRISDSRALDLLGFRHVLKLKLVLRDLAEKNISDARSLSKFDGPKMQSREVND